MLGIRVLHVITRLARGGAERRLYDVIRAVPAEHVVAMGRDSHPVGIEDLLSLPGVSESDLVRCPDLIRSVEPRSDLRAYRHLLGLMRDGSFDVIHTHESKAGLLGRVAARQTGVRLVYHSASMASFGPGYGPTASHVFAAVERASAPLVSRYFVVGRDLANRLAANGVSRRRLEVIRSSQDLRTFVPARPERGHRASGGSRARSWSAGGLLRGGARRPQGRRGPARADPGRHAGPGHAGGGRRRAPPRRARGPGRRRRRWPGSAAAGPCAGCGRRDPRLGRAGPAQLGRGPASGVGPVGTMRGSLRVLRRGRGP